MIQHATTATHGPFRRVVGERERTVTWRGREPVIVIDELLECGHAGHLLRDIYGHRRARPGKRRRCMECRGATR